MFVVRANHKNIKTPGKLVQERIFYEKKIILYFVGTYLAQTKYILKMSEKKPHEGKLRPDKKDQGVSSESDRWKL